MKQKPGQRSVGETEAERVTDNSRGGTNDSEGKDRSWRAGKQSWYWGRLGGQSEGSGELCRARRKEPRPCPSALGVRELGEHPEETRRSKSQG